MPRTIQTLLVKIKVSLVNHLYGDDKIIDSELITVQLYNIEIKNRPEYGVVKTLAVFIPNHMTRSFVSTLNTTS